MIFTERTITVVNDSATINKPLILYRGDKNIELKITIAESQFKFRNTDASNVIETTDASYAQLVINTPYNSPIFSDVAATKNGAVIFVITEAMIDEIREVGAYEIQIRLLDDNKQSRASIPPVSNAIEIREPIAIEDGSAVDSNAVNVAKVNRALTTTSAPLKAFDSQGNYIKNNWGDGDPITDAALNKIEVGIDGVNKKIGNVNSQIKDIVIKKMDKNSLIGMSNLSQEVKEGMTGGSVAVVGKGAVLDENISESSFVKAVTNNFLEQGLFSDGSEFLCDNTYTEVNDKYTNRTIGNGLAFGFTYNHNYDKLIIKGIKADNNGTLTIGVATRENATGNITEVDTKCIYTKKVSITANEQLDFEVDISDMNALLTKGQYYMMLFCSVLDIESPTYNSNNAIYLKKIIDKGELVKETPIEDIKFILNHGSYGWNSISSTSNPCDYIPAISLRRQPETRYKCDIDNYVKRKTLEVTKPLIDEAIQLQSNKQVSNFVPNDIPLVKDDTIEIFYDSIFNVKNIGNYNLKVENALNDFFERKATITATSNTENTITKVTLVDDFNNEVSNVDLNFKVYPVKNPTTQKNLLIIGDSLTEFGDTGGCETASTLYEKLQEKAITNINFIGTKSGRNANAKNEGRAGWRSWDYTNINKEGNPFVYNGVIDFNAYCTANNFSGIDYCIIHMNWNAFSFPKETKWSTLKALADKVLESYPNCKMFIVGMSAYSKYKYSGRWYCTKETVWEIDRYYQEQCDKLDNFRYVSLLPYRDMDYGNKYSEVNVNLRNSNQKERQLADHVHCGNVGYQQIADVYFRELVRQINLDS